MSRRPNNIIYTQRHGRLPRQSYPPQTGIFKLPQNDKLTEYLTNIAADERWEEWDYCWSRLRYLPRWDMECIWKGPPGWITPHAFLAWATWHMAVCHQWLMRLYRQISRSHSPEDLLTSERVVNPLYQYIDKGQIEFAKKRTYYALNRLKAGNFHFLPTYEVVTYPPNGLSDFLDYIKADHDLSESVVNFEWYPSRSHVRASMFVREIVPTLYPAAVILSRHLGEAAWSE